MLKHQTCKIIWKLLCKLYGQYVDELHDFRLKWRGSSNQRVIDVPKTLKQGKIVLYCE